MGVGDLQLELASTWKTANCDDHFLYNLVWTLQFFRCRAVGLIPCMTGEGGTLKCLN